MHVCVRVLALVCAYVDACEGGFVYVGACVWVYVCMCGRVCMWLHVCVFGCVCGACECVYVRVLVPL